MGVLKHARLSPSSSSRWLQCTASVEVSEQYENKGNSASVWGTNVHYLGEQLLKGEHIDVGQEHTEQGVKFIVDEEMLECAEDYADYVNSFIDKDSVVLIEEEYDLSFISPNQFGTSDATVLNGTHLHVMDLKTGHGIVMAEQNTQLMLYALGALHELEDIYDVETVTLHIVQTRAGHIDTWEVEVKTLRLFEMIAKSQAEAIINGDVEFNPSEKACKWCQHSINCEALKAHVEDTVKGAFDNLEDIDGQADLIDVEHIKKILDNKDLILSFIKAVEARSLELMQEGTEIDGYKLVEAKTNRKWRDEAEVAKYLNRKVKADDLWVKKLIPMTKILKLRPDDKKLQEMLVKPEGKPVIAPLSDKRQPIGKVADEFEEC